MTEEIKDGGQAFPCINPHYDGNWNKDPVNCGMTLRDYFAADAPITVWDAQMALNKGTHPIGSLPEYARREVFAMAAKLRFEYADAMVAASEVK